MSMTAVIEENEGLDVIWKSGFVTNRKKCTTEVVQKILLRTCGRLTA